jgi:hypothetical protein
VLVVATGLPWYFCVVDCKMRGKKKIGQRKLGKKILRKMGDLEAMVEESNGSDTICYTNKPTPINPYIISLIETRSNCNGE